MQARLAKPEIRSWGPYDEMTFVQFFICSLKFESWKNRGYKINFDFTHFSTLISLDFAHHFFQFKIREDIKKKYFVDTEF